MTRLTVSRSSYVCPSRLGARWTHPRTFRHTFTAQRQHIIVHAEPHWWRCHRKSAKLFQLRVSLPTLTNVCAVPSRCFLDIGRGWRKGRLERMKAIVFFIDGSQVSCSSNTPPTESSLLTRCSSRMLSSNLCLQAARGFQVRQPGPSK